MIQMLPLKRLVSRAAAMVLALSAIALSDLVSPAGAATPALGAGDAKTFVEWIFSHYQAPARGHWSERNAWDPLDATSAPAVFAPSTALLLRENDHLTRQGDEGAMDYDPFCECQDSMGRVAWTVSVRMTGPTAATAVVTQRGTPSDAVTLMLVNAAGHWRVYDLREKDLPSLRQAFIDDSRAKAADRPAR
jgi:hypothetical protein